MSTFSNRRRARVTARARECGAICGLYCLGKCALVAGDCGVTAALEPVVRVFWHTCAIRLPAELAFE